MTWRTPSGDRVLQGSEAVLYLSAMQLAVEYLDLAHEADCEPDITTGDRIFDGASFHQKIVLLHTCLCALLKPEIAVPDLTSVLEAAAYFPFAFLQNEIANEIEADEAGFSEGETFQYSYRSLVWSIFDKFIRPRWESAIEEFGEDEEESAFNEHSTNLSLWESIIDAMADLIFWDRDWQMSSLKPELLDGIPEFLSQETGLEESYLINRLPKVTAKQAEIALAAIRRWEVR
jgi:hypothetical protein